MDSSKHTGTVTPSTAISAPVYDLETRKRLHALTKQRVQESLDIGVPEKPCCRTNESPHNRRG
jgi:hypothetical protein